MSDKDLLTKVTANPYSYIEKAPVKTADGKAVSNATYIDPDTLRVDGTTHRLTGFDAPETAKLKGGIFVPSARADDRTGYNVDEIAKAGGFTSLSTTGKTDKYGRQLSRLENEVGTNLGDMLTALGVTENNIHSSDEALRRQALMRAAAALNPGQAKRDPMIAIAQKEKEKRLFENKGNPLYSPRVWADDEAQHAAINASVGISAMNRETEEITRLENALATGRMAPETRVKLTKELEEARGRLFMAATVPALSGGVVFRHDDRNMNNMAYDQTGTTWARSVSDMWKGLGGIESIVGEELKWDWLKKRGDERQIREKIAQADMPQTLSSYKDLRFDDPWTGITSTATYLANMFTGSLPMFGLMAAATVGTAGLGLAGATGAAVSTIPSSLAFAGQFYADQPDDKKNPSLAIAAGIAAAALDRLGFEAFINPKMIFEKAAREEVLQTMLRSNRYATIAEARTALEQATKRTLIDLSEGGALFAKQFYAGTAAKMRAIGQVGIGLGSEATTETLQTLVELAATSSNPSTDIRYAKDFEEQLLNAAIGGGVLGGGISFSGAAINMAQWHSAANAIAVARNELYQSQEFQREARPFIDAAQNNGLAAGDRRGVSNVDELLDTLSVQVDSRTPGISEIAPEGSFKGEVKKILMDGWRLVRQGADTAIPLVMNEDGSPKWNLAHLKSIFKPGILPGDSYAGFTQRLLGGWQSMSPEDMATILQTNIANVNTMIREAWLSTWAHGKDLPRNSPENRVLQDWKDSVDLATSQTQDWLAQAGALPLNFNASISSIFEDAAIDTGKLRSHAGEAVRVMMANGSNESDARQAVANVLGRNPTLQDSGRRWMSQHGVFSDRNLSGILDANIFRAFENYKHKAANQIAGLRYFGDGGKKLAFLLQEAWNAGEFGTDRTLFEATTKEISDLYKITQGTYGSLANHPIAEKAIGMLVTMSMLASLTKATLSSIPEVALSILGTSGPKVVDQITRATSSFVREWRADFNAFASWGFALVGIEYARKIAHPEIQQKIDELEQEVAALHASGAPNAWHKIEAVNEKLKTLYSKDFGQSLFDLLGFNDSGYNSQTKFETMSGNLRHTMQIFAKAIGLRALSDGVRLAAVSMCADIVATKISMLQAIPRDRRIEMLAGRGMSNEQFYSLRELQMHGMDVIAVLEALDSLQRDVELYRDIFPGGQQTPAEVTIRSNLLTTIGSMVDSRSANPQVHNLPKYYWDPRLRPITAMTRFVATQTAVLLPRLYKDFIVHGDTGMRYQAFSAIAGALMLGAFANALKDELSYEDGENPWLKGNREELQRVLYASGLIGRLDSAVDTVMPLYPKRDINPIETPVRWAWDKATDVSAPLDWSDKVVRAAYNIADGNIPKGVELGVRASPVIGAFPKAAKDISKQFKDDKK